MVSIAAGAMLVMVIDYRLLLVAEAAAVTGLGAPASSCVHPTPACTPFSASH